MKQRIGILFGGPSPEHLVSIASARAVTAALDTQRYTGVPVYIDRGGRWWGSRGTKAVLNGAQKPTGVPLTSQQRERLLQQLDCAMPILHGAWGEDGTIQAVLEFFGVPYTGSTVAASALGMDKARSRAVITQAGALTPRSVLLTRSQLAKASSAVRTVGQYPVVVKPNRAGSSIGISLVRSSAGLPAALRAALRHDTEILIEQFIAGRELTVAVLNGRTPKALPVTEIRVSHGFFDWHAKYDGATEGTTQELCPAPIPAPLARRAQATAILAHRALGCSGLTRTDMILSSSGRLTVLEVNTLPGLTAASLAPRALRAAGISLRQLLTTLLTEAVNR